MNYYSLAVSRLKGDPEWWDQSQFHTKKTTKEVAYRVDQLASSAPVHSLRREIPRYAEVLTLKRRSRMVTSQ